MSAKSSEPAYYPPPPPLLPRGMRPANPTMFTQRHMLPQQQLPPGHMLPPAVMMAMAQQQQQQQQQHQQQQAQAIPPPAVPSTSPVQAPLSASQFTPEELEKRIDKSSIRGNFGWMTMDNVNIPCIFRSDEKYVSVRMVEQKLLSKYPSTYPDELRQRAPLMSQFITPFEAKLLNEINIEHCECEFGQQAFTEKDLIVSWTDFGEFYKIVKKHFPNENIAAKQKHCQPATSCGGGWVQINNTVVPYLKRLSPSGKETLRIAPLPVIKYAAGLLTDTEVPCLEPTDEECRHLTDMCQNAGLEFKFSKTNTQLVLLSMIQAYTGTKVVIKKLPDDDPFASAEYCPELGENPEPIPQCGVILPTIQGTAPPYSGLPVTNGHPFMTPGDKRPPPNVTVSRSGGPPHGASSPSLQALEQMSGAPLKRQKTSATSSAPGPGALTSPNQVNGDMMRGSNPPRMAQPGFVPPYGAMPYGLPTSQMMQPPGVPPGGIASWPPMPQHPADMQKLAEIMNMQAAILSQTGPIRPPMMPTPRSMSMMPQQPRKPAQIKGIQSKASPAESATKQSTENSVLQTIKPMDFHGKKISCLVKDATKQQFALIEAISRVYFPHCSLEEFIDALTKVLQISIYQLNREEEKAFITFYGLPTQVLKCNKVLNLKDLDQHMPQLKYMFERKDAARKDGASKPQPSGQPVSSSAPASQDTNNNASNPSHLGAHGGASVPTTSHLPPSNPFKKTPGGGYKPKAGSLSKMSSKLEDAVNRLRQNKMMEASPTATSTVTTSSTDVVQSPVIPRNPFGQKTQSSPEDIGQ